MSRVAQYLHLHHHHGASDPDAPHPPMGGSRNEAIGLLVVLVILTLIALGFFWQSARKIPVVSPSHAELNRSSAGAAHTDGAASHLDHDAALPRAGSFSSVRDSWMQTDPRAKRERPVERVASLAPVGADRSI